MQFTLALANVWVITSLISQPEWHLGWPTSKQQVEAQREAYAHHLTLKVNLQRREMKLREEEVCLFNCVCACCLLCERELIDSTRGGKNANHKIPHNLLFFGENATRRHLKEIQYQFCILENLL